MTDRFQQFGDAPVTAINKTLNQPAAPNEAHPTVDPTAGIQRYLNQRGPGAPTQPPSMKDLPGVHPDFGAGYQVVSLLHPNGQTHQVAIPKGTSVDDVIAANPHYSQG